MTEAIASYTPNIPWLIFQQSPEIRENGEGTSAATPQVAAAVALWYEKYKSFLPRDWRRVEAVRNALFSSAKAKRADPQHFGNGILQANAALAVAPSLNLPQTPPDSDSFSFLRVITGLGVTDAPLREQMFNPFVTTKKSGVGLGLSIVSKIVDEHHGTIRLDNSQGQVPPRVSHRVG